VLHGIRTIGTATTLHRIGVRKEIVIERPHDPRRRHGIGEEASAFLAGPDVRFANDVVLELNEAAWACAHWGRRRSVVHMLHEYRHFEPREHGNTANTISYTPSELGSGGPAVDQVFGFGVMTHTRKAGRMRSSKAGGRPSAGIDENAGVSST
jgi:hypothetical protein